MFFIALDLLRNLKLVIVVAAELWNGLLGRRRVVCHDEKDLPGCDALKGVLCVDDRIWTDLPPDIDGFVGLDGGGTHAVVIAPRSGR